MLCISRAVRGGGLRDELQGAKSKARLRALPGFATTRIARKTTKGSARANANAFAGHKAGPAWACSRPAAQTGALPTKPLARSYGYVTRGIGEQFIPFLTRTRMAGLMQSIPRATACL
jgi:hypothetical protein